MNTHMKSISTRIAAGIAAVFTGLAVGLTGSASANPTLQTSVRLCASRTDTICVVMPQQPRAEGPAEIRFVQNNRFCVQWRRGGPFVTRCEQYWPFTDPVINAQLAPSTAFRR